MAGRVSGHKDRNSRGLRVVERGGSWDSALHDALEFTVKEVIEYTCLRYYYEGNKDKGEVMGVHLNDFRQGDTVTIKIDYGTGFDITGYEFWFTMRADFDDLSPIIAQISTTAGDHTLDDIVNGLAHIELDSVTSAAIPVGGYVYDVQRGKPNGANPKDILTLLPPVADFDDVLLVAAQVTKATVV